MRKPVAILSLCLLLVGGTARAHRLNEYLQATIVSLGATRADVAMRMIPGIMVAPSVILAIDRDRDESFSEDEKAAYADRVLHDLSVTIDGQATKAHLDFWTVPDASQLRDGLGEIKIHYHIDLPPERGMQRRLILANYHLNANSVYLMNVEIPQDQNLRVMHQKRNEQQSVYEIDYEQASGAGAVSAAPVKLLTWLGGLGFSRLFRLGMHHIAEGTDHLLFLLVLMLPASLQAASSRWGQPRTVRQSLMHILGIVTAFTVGHSLTLCLAAMNVVHVPARPVEVLIAVSILVSAIHALRPIFPGKEARIAALFGLIHGLAFATTLDRLGLSRWDRVVGILAFNVGIETMQLLVVAAILPSLLLLSRTRPYSILRVAAACVAGTMSIAWICERLFGVQTHIEGLAAILTHQGLWAALMLFILSVACTVFLGRQHEGVL